MTTDLGDKLPDLDQQGPHANSALALSSLPGVSVQVVIGSARLPLAQVATLAPGATLTLEEKLGAPARMLVNGREVARGDLFVVDESDGRLGITITEVSGPTSDP